MHLDIVCFVGYPLFVDVDADLAYVLLTSVAICDCIWLSATIFAFVHFCPVYEPSVYVLLASFVNQLQLFSTAQKASEVASDTR